MSLFFFFKQKPAYGMRFSDWSSDVCSSDLGVGLTALGAVVVAGSFVALGLRPDGIASYYRDTLTPAGFAIWFCGFVAATLAPPAIAVLCWFGAMRFRYGWLLHILLVPATYAAV